MRVLCLKNEACEGPGLLSEYCLLNGIMLEQRERGEDFAADGFDALVVLGGPMNVYETDKFPFLLEEEKAIRHRDNPGYGEGVG